MLRSKNNEPFAYHFGRAPRSEFAPAKEKIDLIISGNFALNFTDITIALPAIRLKCSSLPLNKTKGS